MAAEVIESLSTASLSGALGAEVSGVDLADLTPADTKALQAAFLEHRVLVFRDQHLDPSGFVAAARAFGAPTPYPFARGIEGHPDITVIVKEAHQTSNFGGMWHSDTTYRTDPPKATMLLCVETPPIGGDTVFACQYRAFETLSDGLQNTLRGLHGVSSSAKNASALRTTHLATGAMQGSAQTDVMTASHPVVRRHPETGREALFVNRSHTVAFDGWSEDESSGLLELLFQHQIRPEFTARVQWTPGTVVIWDNRATQHCAINDYDGHRREMWRVTLGS